MCYEYKLKYVADGEGGCIKKMFQGADEPFWMANDNGAQ